VTYALTVLLFYKAVDFSSVASADILDITYSLFVATFSRFSLSNQRDVAILHIVSIASLGFFAANIFLAV